MAEWLSANIGNIIVLLILAAVIALSIITIIKDKKSGKGSCGCGCKNCCMNCSAGNTVCGNCHASKQ